MKNKKPKGQKKALASGNGGGKLFTEAEVRSVAKGYLKALNAEREPGSPEITAEDVLKAQAAGLGTPQFNAGLYQGRPIPELDPTRYGDITPMPAGVRPSDNHNMTNITYPSLNDDLIAPDDEALVEPQTPDPVSDVPVDNEDVDTNAPIEEEDLVGLGDPMPGDDDALASTKAKKGPNKIMISMAGIDSEPQMSAPQKLRFFLAPEGFLHIEAAAKPRPKSKIKSKAKPGGKNKATTQVLESTWWKSLSPTAKRTYLQQHPASKYAKAVRKAIEIKRAKAANGGKNLKKGGSNRPKVVRELDQEAELNKKKGETEIPEELDNEQDEHLDDLTNSMNEELDRTDDDGTEAEDREDRKGTPPPLPKVDKQAVDDLGKASKKPGFFKPIVNAVKKRASNSTLGAMGRFIKGSMKEGDKEKVAHGISLMVSAMVVVGVGAGIAAFAGPGAMTHYVANYVNSMHPREPSNDSGDDEDGDDDGFDFGFSGEAADAIAKATKVEKADIPDNATIEKLSQHFLEWLKKQTEGQDDNG